MHVAEDVEYFLHKTAADSVRVPKIRKGSKPPSVVSRATLTISANQVDGEEIPAMGNNQISGEQGKGKHVMLRSR